MRQAFGHSLAMVDYLERGFASHCLMPKVCTGLQIEAFAAHLSNAMILKPHRRCVRSPAPPALSMPVRDAGKVYLEDEHCR